MQTETNWSTLRHAYGSADDIPALLNAALAESRPGHDPNSVWFDLWSALCHQGDAYSASLAAVPRLVEMAPGQLRERSYEALLLAASIEQARLEGRAPAIPEALTEAYSIAISEGLVVAEAALPQAWSNDAALAIRGSIAVFKGDLSEAQAIFNADLPDDNS